MGGMHDDPTHDDRWLELVSAHADDELDAAEAAPVADHLASCPSCAELAVRFASDRRRARLGAPAAHAELASSILAAAPAAGASAGPDRTAATLGWRLAAAAVVLVALGLAVVLGTDRTRPPNAAQLAQRSILLDDDGTPLVDGDLTVEAGTTVRLRNSGDETHRLRVEADGTTTTSDVVPGAADAVTYDTSGTYTYRCTIHPEVAGTVTVEEA